MHGEQGLVGRQQVIETPLFIVGKFVVVAEQQKPAFFQGLGFLRIDVVLLFTAQGIDLPLIRAMTW